ncbi:citrinin biosynthesis oxidoreductase CtnB [Rhypophila decipiens]|uniref:Citrinin biosynthesis oxidoreductase CtnB n=1 Tax=Rhypophila decipiens TaxID=261697 RepID=A0AAN7BEE2_9PEZI|nr:citrinin biosynthesis oxidoreductase CtnB [Rhypophila decipiens]
MSRSEKAEDATLALPRILCLHGGGVNAKVFGWQCRSIIRVLTPYFRLVFADGPFECHPHPDIVPVYGEHGPFYRWLRWMDRHEPVPAHEACKSILEGLQKFMDADEGTGEWVGVLGFSQGAKIAGSLLWSQEWFKEKWKERKANRGLNVNGNGNGHSVGGGGPFGSAQDEEEEVVLLRDNTRGGKAVEFKFGVVMAGSAPTVMLDPRPPKDQWGYAGGYEYDSRSVPRYVETADKTSLSFSDWPSLAEVEGGEHVITLPTLHVHGLADPGLERHRKLLELYCKRGTTKLVEWGGDHRLPIKTADVEPVTGKIMEMAWETGVI